QSPEAIGPQNRVMRFAKAVWVDPDECKRNIEQVLRSLSDAGHSEGLISNSSIYIWLVAADDHFWRCSTCSRVHLHRGAGFCTRCNRPLPADPGGIAADLRRRNFLAQRIERPGSSTFRLHCEELTGQTDRPDERQRRFKNILLRQGDQPLYRNKELIDLL